MDEQPARLHELAEFYRRIARKMSDPQTIEALEEAAEDCDRRARLKRGPRFTLPRKPH